MTRDKLQWLSEPAKELQGLPAGTLLVLRSPSGLIHLGEVFPPDSAEAPPKYRRFPDCRVFTAGEQSALRVQVAVIDENANCGVEKAAVSQGDPATASLTVAF